MQRNLEYCLFSLLIGVSCVVGVPLTNPLPDAPGSLHQKTISCDGGGGEFKYIGTDTDGDGIKFKYSCGSSQMEKLLSCQSGFKAYSKRDAIACDPSNAIFRDADTDANNMNRAVVIWYCMKKTGVPCTSSR